VAGSKLGEHPKNLGPLLTSAPMKLATSSSVHNLGFEISLRRDNLQGQNWRGPDKGSIKKLGPRFISETVETSNVKFGTQLKFGE